MNSWPRRRFAGVSMICIFLSAPQIALGEDQSGQARLEDRSDGRWYGTIGIGWNAAEALKLDGNAVIDYDFGLPSGTLGLGVHAFGDWRFEMEASHQENAPEVLYVRGTDVELDTPHKDRLQASSLLFNAIRDFHLGIGLRPYLGLGIGPSRVGLRFNELRGDGSRVTIIDDQDWTFAYQAMAGVTIPLGERLALGIEYRYWQAPSLGLDDESGAEVDGPQTIQSGWLRLNYRPGGYHWRPSPDPARGMAPGFNLGASAGGGWATDRDFLGVDGQMDAFAIGPMASLSVGYDFGRRWRLELEAARRSNDMQIYDLLVSEQRTKGDVRADSLLLNAVYRFRPDAAINPRIGLGFGAAKIRYDLELAADRQPLIRDSDTTTAMQLTMGFDIALTKHWTATADYRAWLSDEVTFDYEGGGDVTVTHFVHSWSVGMRYSFATDR